MEALISLLIFLGYIPTLLGYVESLYEGCYTIKEPFIGPSLSDTIFRPVYIADVTNHKKQCYDHCAANQIYQWTLMFNGNECVCLSEYFIGYFEKSEDDLCTAKCSEWVIIPKTCGSVGAEIGSGSLYSLPARSNTVTARFEGCFTWAPGYGGADEHTKQEVSDIYRQCFLDCLHDDKNIWIFLENDDKCACLDLHSVHKLAKVQTVVCSKQCRNFKVLNLRRTTCGGYFMRPFASRYNISVEQKRKQAARSELRMLFDESIKSDVVHSNDVFSIGCYTWKSDEPFSVADISDTESTYDLNINQHGNCYVKCTELRGFPWVIMYKGSECACLDTWHFSSFKKTKDDYCDKECGFWKANNTVLTCGGLHKAIDGTQQAYGTIYQVGQPDIGRYEGCYKVKNKPTQSSLSDTIFKSIYLSGINDPYPECYLRCSKNKYNKWVLLYNGNECLCVSHYTIGYLEKTKDIYCDITCDKWPFLPLTCGSIKNNIGVGSLYTLSNNTWNVEDMKYEGCYNWQNDGTIHQKHTEDHFKDCFLNCLEDDKKNWMILFHHSCTCLDSLSLHKLTKGDSKDCSDPCHLIHSEAFSTTCGGNRILFDGSHGNFGSVYDLSIEQNNKRASRKVLTKYFDDLYKKQTLITYSVLYSGCFMSASPPYSLSVADFSLQSNMYVTHVKKHGECYKKCKKLNNVVWVMMYKATECMCLNKTNLVPLKRTDDELCNTKCEYWAAKNFNVTCGGIETTSDQIQKAYGSLYQLVSRDEVSLYDGCYTVKAPKEQYSLADTFFKSEFIPEVRNQYKDCYLKCSNNRQNKWVYMFGNDECLCITTYTFGLITKVDDELCDTKCSNWPIDPMTCGSLSKNNRVGSLYTLASQIHTLNEIKYIGCVTWSEGYVAPVRSMRTHVRNLYKECLLWCLEDNNNKLMVLFYKDTCTCLHESSFKHLKSMDEALCNQQCVSLKSVEGKVTCGGPSVDSDAEHSFGSLYDISREQENKQKVRLSLLSQYNELHDIENDILKDVLYKGCYIWSPRQLSSESKFITDTKNHGDCHTKCRFLKHMNWVLMYKETECVCLSKNDFANVIKTDDKLCDRKCKDWEETDKVMTCGGNQRPADGRDEEYGSIYRLTPAEQNTAIQTTTSVAIVEKIGSNRKVKNHDRITNDDDKIIITREYVFDKRK